jgi:hypothetical protein
MEPKIISSDKLVHSSPATTNPKPMNTGKSRSKREHAKEGRDKMSERFVTNRPNSFCSFCIGYRVYG